MVRKKIFVTREVPQSGLRLLKSQEDCEVFVHRGDEAPSREELLRATEEVHALLSLLSDTVDSELLSKAKSLEIVANYAVGFDNIDVDFATKQGIWVSNTPGVLTEATADWAFALLLAACRRVVEADQYVRQGCFKGWKPQLLLGRDLYGSTLGIIGMGRIGAAFARRAKGFGLELIYHSRSRCSPELEDELALKYVELDELLNESDFISLHVPGGAETCHLIDREAFSKMKEGVVLVNTSRGTVVDEGALVETLKSGYLGAAALDVFEEEPKVHPALLEMDRVVLAPHIGSATVGVREKMSSMAAENILASLDGKEPPNAVNSVLKQKGEGK